MDDDAFVSQLPARVRARLYLSGLLCFVPPWAVFLAIVGAGVANECRLRYFGGAFVEGEWKVMFTLALGVGAATAMSHVHRAIFEPAPDLAEGGEGGDPLWGSRMLALVMALACVCAISNPWARSHAMPYSRAGVEAAYAADQSALADARKAPQNERMERAGRIQAHGELAKMFDCQLCVARMAKLSDKGAVAWPELARVERRAKAANASRSGMAMMGAIAFFAALHALLATVKGWGRRRVEASAASGIPAAPEPGGLAMLARVFWTAMRAPKGVIFVASTSFVMACAWIGWFHSGKFMGPGQAGMTPVFFMLPVVEFCAFAMMSMFNVDELFVPEPKWRGLASTALAIGCATALSSPWILPEKMLTRAEVREAYARDEADLRSRSLLSEGDISGVARAIQDYGAVAALLKCGEEDCLPWGVEPSEGGKLAWMPLDVREDQAMRVNGGALMSRAVPVLAVFFLLELMLGPVGSLLAKMSKGSSFEGGPEAAPRSGRFARGARWVLGRPSAMVRALGSAGRTAKLRVQAAALSSPRARVDYERRALKIAAEPPKAKGPGASRL